MNELQIFNNSEFGQVRVTISSDGNPYFVGKDIATILGYSNTKDALATHVDAEDKVILQRSENTTLEIPNRGLTIINESGLYSLVLSSKLPTAKKFKRWVTSEVLPAIRKTGGYVQHVENMSQELQMFGQMYKIMTNHEIKMKQLETQQNETIQKLDNALDVFTSSVALLNWKDDINKKINTICKTHKLNYQMVRHEMYEELEGLGRCNLILRVKNQQERMQKAGATYKERTAVNRLDVISNDTRLKAIFDGIVRKWQAKYIQGDDVQDGFVDWE